MRKILFTLITIFLPLAVWSNPNPKPEKARTQYGENFSWSIEYEGCVQGAVFGPEELWMIEDSEIDENGDNLTGPFLALYVLPNRNVFEEAYLEWEDENGEIFKDELSVMTEGDIIYGYNPETGIVNNGLGTFGCEWIGNNQRLIMSGDEYSVPCILLHDNCKNVIKVKYSERELLPTTVNFSFIHPAEYNGYPLYDDCPFYLDDMSVVVASHYNLWDGNYETPVFTDSITTDTVSIKESFSKVIDFGNGVGMFEDNYPAPQVGHIDFLRADNLEDEEQIITFTPSLIQETGEYEVGVAYNLTGEYTANDLWGSNIQFDLDGLGSVEMQDNFKVNLYSKISGEGIVGQKHYKDSPTTVYLKLIPNRRMVLESAKIVYESGLADSVVVSELSTIYNEKGRYYELTLSEEELAEGCGFHIDGKNLVLEGGFMTTVVLRFKDDETLIKFADENVNDLCVGNWDANGDGEFSYDEAAGVTNLGMTFYNQDITSFDELVFFTALESIPDNAFADCANLQSIILPDSLSSIGHSAFFGCSSLSTISIPETVSIIGDDTFFGCNSLEAIMVDEGNEQFISTDGVLYTKDFAMLLKYPIAKTDNSYGVLDNTKTIARNAFANSHLSAVTLPVGLETVEYGAFSKMSNLSKIVIPEGVTSIGDRCFESCTSIKSVVFPSTLIDMGLNIFKGITKLKDVSSYMVSPMNIADNNFTSTVYNQATLHVPEGCESAYAAADGWKRFAKISSDLVKVEKDFSVMASEVVVRPGRTASLTIGISNGEILLNGYQFDIDLPEGTTLVKDDEGDFVYELADRYTDKEKIMVSINGLSNGNYRLICYSNTNETLIGSDGDVITLQLQADKDMGDNLVGTLKNISLSTIEGTSLHPNKVDFTIRWPEFELGDVNHDGIVNVADLMLVVNNILGNENENYHEDCADINGDNLVDVADVMLIVKMILDEEDGNGSSDGDGSGSCDGDDNGSGDGDDNGNDNPETESPDLTNSLRMVTQGNNILVGFDKSEQYVAFQMSVQLPDGVALLSTDMSYKSSGHQVIVNDLGNGRYNLVVFTLRCEPFNCSAQESLLCLTTNEPISDGVMLSNIQLANHNFETIVLPDIIGCTDRIKSVGKVVGDGVLYNLNGQKIKNPVHGVYIQNGQKRIRK